MPNLMNLLRIAILSLGLASTLAEAGVRVQPMSYDLDVVGQKARQDLRVENTGNAPVPVELKVERREILPDGSDRRTPADDDFLIFPPQGVVPANGFQTFRVQYVGDPAISKTHLYQVTVAQLPVEVGGSQTTGIQLVFNIGTLAAVSPARSAPALIVTDVAPAPEAGHLRITVRNDGTRYARLLNGTWTFVSSNGVTETLDGERLRSALQNSLIEPGRTRVVALPVSDKFIREGARATFQLSRNP